MLIYKHTSSYARIAFFKKCNEGVFPTSLYHFNIFKAYGFQGARKTLISDSAAAEGLPRLCCMRKNY